VKVQQHLTEGNKKLMLDVYVCAAAAAAAGTRGKESPIASRDVHKKLFK
jgi:hypothetical protein